MDAEAEYVRDELIATADEERALGWREEDAVQEKMTDETESLSLPEIRWLLRSGGRATKPTTLNANSNGEAAGPAQAVDTFASGQVRS